MAEIPAAPVADTPAAEPSATLEQINAMRELLETQSAQIAALTDTITAASVPEPEPVDPDKDPDNQPFQTPRQVREEIRREAEKITRSELERVETERKRISDEEAGRRADLDRQFDSALEKAQELGLIAPIGDKSSSDDKGNRDRREVFGLAAKLGTSNLLDVAKQIKGLHDNGLEYDYQKDEVVKSGPSDQGNQRPLVAPVSSSSARSGNPGSGKPDYKDLHAKSLDALIAQYGK